MTVAAKHAEVEKTIIESLIEFGADSDAITLDASLEELDIDSLDLVELAQIAEERFGVTFDVDDAQGVKTVRDALDLILARMP